MSKVNQLIVPPGKTKEYSLWWRFLGDHNPAAWQSIGRATIEHYVLRDIGGAPEDTPVGGSWDDGAREFKIMERSVVRSEWHNETE